MDMGGWVDFLHFHFSGEHVLFEILQLNSLSAFLLASVLTTLLCWCERFISFSLSKHYSPSSFHHSRIRIAAWRSLLYYVVTLLRLVYMLIAMTFHIGLLLVLVTALSMGQFVIEYLEVPDTNPRDFDRLQQPLIYRPMEDRVRMNRTMMTQPRSKSKPEGIFIHPTHSNLARADAAALELGIGGETERVKAFNPPSDQNPWQHGRGKDFARELFSAQQPYSPEHQPFRIHDEDEDEMDSLE